MDSNYKPDYHPGYTKEQIIAIRNNTIKPTHDCTNTYAPSVVDGKKQFSNSNTNTSKKTLRPGRHSLPCAMGKEFYDLKKLQDTHS